VAIDQLSPKSTSLDLLWIYCRYTLAHLRFFTVTVNALTCMRLNRIITEWMQKKTNGSRARCTLSPVSRQGWDFYS